MTMIPPPGRLFCFGFGFCARQLAERLLPQGWTVAGTARAPAEAAPAGPAIPRHAFAREHPLPAPAALLAGTTHLLVSIPPDDSGDAVLDKHAGDLAALPDLRWVGYLSTTGVYGDRAGGWVDEADALRPTGERGRRRVAAEDAWRALGRRTGIAVHCFRLAGIYGPGRSALDTLRAGRAQRIDKPGQVFSRIHVADVAATLVASMARPNPGAAYNVCDDDPAPPADVIAYAAELLGVAPPPLVPFETAALSPMARSFYDDNKRVSNRRIKEELGVRLTYPSYRQGLVALLASSPSGVSAP
jgi:nucleoside-diphosphate-sugar epimerase